jgi:hypothetical protein
LIILPLGVMAVRAMIPAIVLAECRDRATRLDGKPRNWLGAAMIILVWIALAVVGGYWLAGWLRRSN